MPADEPCGSAGKPKLRDPDAKLNVRAGPDKSYRVIAQIAPDESFSICGTSRGGWLAIVVHPSTGKKDCGLSEAEPDTRPYEGPCKYGWIAERYSGVFAD